MSIEAVLDMINEGEILADEINGFVHEHFDDPEGVLRVIREQLCKPRKVRSECYGNDLVFIDDGDNGYDCLFVDLEA